MWDRKLALLRSRGVRSVMCQLSSPNQHRQLRTQMDRFVSRVPVAQGIQRRAQEPISPVLVVPAQASISLFSHLLESRMV
jgi:hypothetical protein